VRTTLVLNLVNLPVIGAALFVSLPYLFVGEWKLYKI
jgi:hypothetical protein